MATWAVVKAQARDILGIELTDADVFGVPLLATDAYGNFLRGPNGFPQVVMRNADGTTSLVEGDPTANGGLGISLANAVRTGHAFLDDIAHTAAPNRTAAADTDGRTSTRRRQVLPQPRLAPTTTSCSTRTTSPATAA